MSPEVCSKQKYDGPANDIWAAGILLFTCLFGMQPFRAPNEQDLYRKIQKAQYKLPDIMIDN